MHNGSKRPDWLLKTLPGGSERTVVVDMLLVNPLVLARDPVERQLMMPYFPLGLLYLAATLRDAGYRVALFDGAFCQDTAAFEDALDIHQPRAVGISILSTVRDAASEFASLARDRGIPVVVGGADPTGRPDSYLLSTAAQREPIADVVVVGEGEETLLELLPAVLGLDGHKPLASIRGIAYRNEAGTVVRTPPRSLRHDLDSLPLPARDLVDIEAYQRAWRQAHGFSSLSLIATRGCPYGCAWCQKSVFGRTFRPRSPELVAEEMRLIKKQYQPDQLRIVDDVMGIDRGWLRRWRDAVLNLDAVIPFECLSRVDLVDREMLTWLKEAGCARISFGAESGSQRILDAMNKGTTVEQARRAASLCHELGIQVYFYIMVGYLGEEWDDIRKTARFLRETMPDAFSSTIAYPLPGTPFYDQVADRLIQAHDWRYTAENRTLYRGRYHTLFYRWVQRWFYKEWQVARLCQKIEPVTPLQALKGVGGLALVRVALPLLRLLPPDARAVPLSVPGH